MKMACDLYSIYDVPGSRTLGTFAKKLGVIESSEGLHDAEYHTHSDGFNHGWRDASTFGGTTYEHNGSHGCINLLNDTAKTTGINKPNNKIFFFSFKFHNIVNSINIPINTKNNIINKKSICL